MRDLRELCCEPTLVVELSREEAAAALVELVALQSALAARLQATPSVVMPAQQHAEGDRLLTVAQAAEVLNVTVGWLYRRSGRLPFARKFGGILRFSERGLRAWAANQRT